MDFASIIGIIGCFIIIVFGIIFGNNISVIMNFINIPSVLITFGGASLCMVVSAKSLRNFISSLGSIRLIMKVPVENEADTIKEIINLSNVARKEGLLALEEAANAVEDPFLKKGLLLIVDGTDPELVRNILDTELSCIERRHGKVVGFWENYGAMGPAWGMIGTLIGLINMLKQLDDISTVGPNMSVALITTLYGSMLANWICIPVATKLKSNNSSEIILKEVIVEGLLSIQAGENPRVIEEKLKSFIPPTAREELSESGEPNG